MNITNKRIGIWGFGVVGKAATAYFLRNNTALQVMDKRELNEQERALLAFHNIPYFTQENARDFLEQNDYILASPGIDLRPYAAYAHKWLTELDIFQQTYQGKIVTITGSIGKTSVTHLLGTLINALGTKAHIGGNIGIGMLELLNAHEQYPLAVIEASSFQLEQCASFAPDLAIITNIYPNHLDRHTNFTEYLRAKCAMLARQKSHQKAILPLELYDTITQEFPTHTGQWFWYTKKTVTAEDRQRIGADGLIEIVNGHISMTQSGHATALIALEKLPSITFEENWLLITSALHILGFSLENMARHAHGLSVPNYRLTRVATINGITFYNDSKSTTPLSTQAAIDRLSPQSIRLFFGGLSKGIDREPFIAALSKNVVHVYCFGKEAEKLHALCAAHGKPSSCHATLEDAFAACTQAMLTGECILLSPAGSSYDLFKDYQARGQRFNELIALLH